MRRAIGFERPDLHLSETLAAELGLTAQGLLRDQRVRSDRPRVDLVVHEVAQLQEVDVPNGHLLLEALAGHPVVERGLAVRRQARLLEITLDVGLVRAVEDRRREVEPEHAARPPEVGLEDLPDVHSARHAERVEHDVHRTSIRQIRHVLDGQDARDDTLVTVAPGHLVADRELALHRDEDLDQLDHARGELVALLERVDPLAVELLEKLDLLARALLELADGLEGRALLRQHVDALQVVRRELADGVTREDRALGEDLAAVLGNQSRAQRLTFEQVRDQAAILLADDPDLVVEVLLPTLDLLALDRAVTRVLLHALPGEDADVDDDAFDARRRRQRSVAHVTGLLTEDRAEQLLLRRELGLALRRDLADEDVARLDVGADADDAALVEVLEELLRDVGDVPGDLLGAELGVPGLDLELLDVDRGVGVFAHEALADEDRVLEVVTAPGHERDEHVAPERELAVLGAGPVREDLARADALALKDDRLLVDAGVLVRAAELDQRVDVRAEVLTTLLARHADDDAGRVDLVDDAGAPADDHRAGVARRRLLHPGADNRRVGLQERHGLPLHVGAHQGAVGVVVLEERDQRRRHRDELLRRDVDEVDLLARSEDEAAALTRRHALVDETSRLVDEGVRLGDRHLVFFPRGEIEGVRIGLRDAPTALADLGARRLELVERHDLADFLVELAAVGELHVVDDAAVDDLAVRRLDEAVVVDPRVAGQRADQADVRTFRRFDRADAAVVRGVNVAHLEARALTAETTRPECGETTLVRDLRERVGLIHELAELAAAEELLDRRDDRLRVDQVVRHRRGHFLIDRHLLLDRPLHADQADPELVLEELTHAAHAARTEVIDVVDVAFALTEAQEVTHHLVEVVRVEDLLVQRLVRAETRVELQAADPREVVALRVEEHRVEELVRRVEGRRVARAQLAVDLEQRLFRRLHRVLLQGVVQHRPGRVVLGEADDQTLDPCLAHLAELLLRERLVDLDQQLARLRVDHRLERDRAGELLFRNRHVADAGVLEATEVRLPDLDALAEDRLAFVVLDLLQRALLKKARADAPEQAVVLQEHLGRGVELAQDLLVRRESERAQEHGAVELALAVDADVQDLLGVVLELDPSAAVRDDLGHPRDAVRRLEEHTRASVELRDDDALGPVDDEGPITGEHGDLTEVDLLLLDVADRARARILVHVPDDETQRHLQGSRKRGAALLTFVDVVFRRLELVLHEFQGAAFGEIGNRENRLENFLQTGIRTVFRLDLALQKLLVGSLLNLDEVRHRSNRGKPPEVLAHTLTTRKGLSHSKPSQFAVGSGPGCARSPRSATLGQLRERRNRPLMPVSRPSRGIRHRRNHIRFPGRGKTNSGGCDRPVGPGGLNPLWIPAARPKNRECISW